MALSHIFTIVVAGLSLVQCLTIHSKRQTNWDFNTQKVIGVNLGGWFVLEPFITPSLFAQWENDPSVIDEYTFSQVLGQAEASSRLQQHWQTWITAADFQEIKTAGFNHVRIPIGYWAVNPQPGDPYVQGQLTYLDQAIVWARTVGLRVIIDLHGAPGSQNGFDNSGHSGPVNWQSDPNFVTQTLVAIKALTDRYSPDIDVVTAIEVLNEPLGPVLNLDAIKQFYWDAYGNVNTDSPRPAVMIHDAFQDIEWWNGFMNTQSGAWSVILDTHQYEVFTSDLIALTPQQHIEAACAFSGKLASTDKWTIVGEWSGAQTDCAKWLNGKGRGARYDGTYENNAWIGDCQTKYQGPVTGLLDVDKYNLRRYIEAQLDSYSSHTGWIVWTWKTEPTAAPEWNVQAQIQAGLFPQPIDSRQYPGQCS